MSAVGLAMRQCGVTETTSITFLRMGMPVCEPFTSRWRRKDEHVLDWFHIAMKFTKVNR
jgi:hypothetical protein